MKNILFAFIALFASNTVLAQQNEVVRLSEPVQITDSYEVFGTEVQVWEEVLSLSEVINSSEKIDNERTTIETLSIEPVTIETEVAQVCQKKGCFFVARDGEYSARITFKDYGFFIPTDSQGKKVKVKGVFNVKELSEEKAKHYAEDAGENPDRVEGPQKEYSIVATSVLVPRN